LLFVITGDNLDIYRERVEKMTTKTTLTATATIENGSTVTITKETSVAYKYAIILVNEETGEILDTRFSKSYSGAETAIANVARDWGFWNQHTAPIYAVSLKRPTKYAVKGTFTPEQIALIEQALGTSVVTTEIPNAA
jgi:hypothetical protein